MPKTITRGDLNSPHLADLQSALISCGSIGELRSLAPLPRDAQMLIDQAVVEVGLDRLVIAQDLLAEGLVYRLSDPLSVMELYWESASRAGFAQRTMIPDARGERQLPNRSANRIPIYVTMDDFSFNIRTLRASERIGSPLDVSMVSQATRNVNEAIEDQVINGWTDENGALISVGGNTAPGILNAPNASTQEFVDNQSWTHASHSGDDILTDVLNMIDLQQASKFYGPYNLYIPTLYGSKLNQDFKANGDKTIRQRLEEIEVGGRNLRIRVADKMPADKTAMVQMTNNVIDMVVGQTPTEVSWTTPGGFRFHAVVMAIMVARVKSNYEEGSGIVIGEPGTT